MPLPSFISSNHMPLVPFCQDDSVLEGSPSEQGLYQHDPRPVIFYVSPPLERPMIGELCQHTGSTLCSPRLEGICKWPPSLSLPQVRITLESFWPHTPADQGGICQNWEAMGLQISTVYKIPPDRVVSLPVSASAYSACPAPLMRLSLPSSWWSKKRSCSLTPKC